MLFVALRSRTKTSTYSPRFVLGVAFAVGALIVTSGCSLGPSDAAPPAAVITGGSAR